MGQKTHPVGFRLQVSKDWKSTWFTENSFATELESDVKIRKYLKARLPNAGISKVDISRTSKTITITIFTARPGIVIGKGGEEVQRTFFLKRNGSRCLLFRVWSQSRCKGRLQGH